MRNYILLLSLLTLLNTLNALGQTSEQDTTKGFRNDDNIGGASVGRVLELDNEPYTFEYRYQTRYMKGWFDWKNSLNQKYGLQLGINYTSVYMRSSEVINDNNDKNTAGGIFDIQLGWNIVNRKKGQNRGVLSVKLSDRHPYGGLTAPMFHGIFESGYYGLTATSFHNYSFRILEFNYQQTFFENRLGFVIGKIDLPNYFNFHGIAIPAQHFLGYGSSVTSTGNWGNAGLGALVMVRPSPKLYIGFSMIDVYGDLFEDGDFFDLGRNWENGDFMHMAEIGYVPTYEERYFKRISLMAWKSSSYISAGGSEIGSGEGLAFSSHWFFKERFAPYFKFGISNGAGENAFAKKDIQVGHGLRFKRFDMLGTSFSWAEPNIPDSDNQMTFEVFYRLNISAHLEFTADYQYIKNPTLNPAVNSLSYFGFRGRIKL
ncbi:carbohydrate porin [Carboxylicivirga sp. RSCT41]|uniref:carbohydrate porin n=1 Tax=Carboxylicivirga agarovorans TaxID=3417570 RepID=UPI003D337206